ncbi:hypothetical protein Bpfe_020485 [Biomphalaria pfeifferi]|uniref:Uncharacterized protein n=1 Tax=Biomphalaria pfeifferi TaxID=112525 RepID=A0AAD8F4W0_BIOPF|nr:hypothetical protein Bpfe_020485 [Biomphalaria pfeifferi]
MTKKKGGSNQPVGIPGRNSNKPSAGSSAKLKPLYPSTRSARRSLGHSSLTLTVSGKLEVSRVIEFKKKRLTTERTRIGHFAITPISLTNLPQEGDVPSPFTRPISPDPQNCPSHVTIHLRTELRRKAGSLGRTVLWTLATS